MKMFKAYQHVLPYLCSGLLVLTWWSLAFSTSKVLDLPITTSERSSPSFFFPDSLPPIDRLSLQKALSGDVTLMTSLIAEWDLEEEFLQSQGQNDVQRLERDQFVKAQLIGRAILQELPTSNHLTSKIKILPQTYLSADILMALTGAGSIAAIPGGLREHPDLYRFASLDQIPYNIERCSSEEIYEINPTLAFVARYSNPTTVETLQQQSIALEVLEDIESLNDLHQCIHQVGQAIDRPLHAELLSTFIEASIRAIDNRLQQHEPRNALYLSYHTQFSTPNHRTLIGKFIHKLGIHSHYYLLSDQDQASSWRIPLEQETIAALQPETLILSTDRNCQRSQLVMRHPAFALLPALQSNRVYFLDDHIQQSTSQFAVLAYYDLCQALIQSKGF